MESHRHRTQDTTQDTMVATRLGRLRVQTQGDGPPALLWHSLFVDSATWDGLRPRLAEHRRLVVVDGPAHGGSDPVGHPFTVRDCADAAEDVLRALGIEGPVDWLGNAWGGHVGLAFAVAYPDRCRSLVAVASPVVALGPAERRRIRPMVAAYRLLGPLRPLTRAVSDALLGTELRRTDPAAARLVEGPLATADRRGMHQAMQSLMLRRPDLTPLLARVTAPTLFVVAADDPTWTPEMARAAAVGLPVGAVVTVPGGGHVGPLVESATAVADTVSEVWRDPAGAVARLSAGLSSGVAPR